ncbi:TPA: hypothetical protein DCX24_13650 [Candidatus Azambacteria bacterium]|nr:hypothetical protein [Candidatus Azambacteria bacterium]|tara:strand:- start:2460 stop:2654 length:195 start_codon:yes stop_codon:yes gene_type:complete
MSAPQIKIPATYMRGGKIFYRRKLLLQFSPFTAEKCDFSLLAGTNVPGGSSLYRRGSAFFAVGG